MLCCAVPTLSFGCAHCSTAVLQLEPCRSAAVHSTSGPAALCSVSCQTRQATCRSGPLPPHMAPIPLSLTTAPPSWQLPNLLELYDAVLEQPHIQAYRSSEQYLPSFAPMLP